MADTSNWLTSHRIQEVMRVLTIVMAIMTPPMLLASIYGMNFQHMPELNLQLGYPGALALMLLAGIAPYWFFKRKGWL